MIVGGVIAFVFRMAEAKRQVRELRQRDLRDFYKRMLTAYNAAKKTRRLLRAYSYAVKGSVEISRKQLNDLMAELQSAQLDFEALRREAQANPKPFSGRKAAKKAAKKAVNELVADHLDHAQKYLREVLKVHEALGPVPDPLVLGYGRCQHRSLLCFFQDRYTLEQKRISEEERRGFDEQFSKQVDEVRALIVGASDEADAED